MLLQCKLVVLVLPTEKDIMNDMFDAMAEEFFTDRRSLRREGSEKSQISFG